MTATAAAVRAAVARVLDPEIRAPIGDLDMVDDVVVDGDRVRIDLALTIVGCPAADRIAGDARAAALGVAGVEDAEVRLTVMTPARRAALVERLRGTRRMPFTADSLTRVIVVTSGKGGVGKSTVTAGLGVALAARGLSIGIVDADVYGFSIPALLGIAPDVTPTRLDGMMLPPVAHGLKAISIGMFLPPERRDEAVAWRGPMLHRTIEQFLTDTYFGDLDVLLIDSPPGTGDVAISIGQILPHAEVLVITTPQPAAATVAVRAGRLAARMGQRVIGVVETMSPALQPDGSVLDLFGSGGGLAVADALSAGGAPVPLLATVPLSRRIREGGDAGVPAVTSHLEDAGAAAIVTLAGSIARSADRLAGRSIPLSPTAH